MNIEEKQSGWFKITKRDQYVAVNELIKEGKEDLSYYMFLILSSIIIASGLLLANSAILIGGMLITPLLTPVLLIALGLTTGNLKLMQKSTVMILKSTGVIFVIALIMSLIFSIPPDQEFFSSALFNDRIESAFLYFLVAFASGIAVTYSWIRKTADTTLPGISIAVSLVPPIGLVAIWLGVGDFDMMRFSLMVFLFNIIGIVGGALILFSMFKFYRSDSTIAETVEKHEKVEKVEDVIITENDSTEKPKIQI